ncbi:aminomethyltransferase folate-binding domain protein [Yersinia pseudotuberculosis]|uniref:tRNA-modifying protein YgfZ n=1 Tax=Yersinia pseudotuberculosis serotype IB (strain PB1/+) TaxID=502801 RepID=YGFZ_YERPB|nr:tRNA-modifying protein YgfZ [Yersinia pseudotuberculosis]B2K0P7.1 RecName: Full=tRNA-modifying protein YgfZ [Yersinia pseudotuberculosis PB1/+]CQD55008.1 putative global regulator [Yersinia intermedia]AJJ01589.1 aminomethyltransferase folate-binding domain protein [Yersinia pseudotuberculosis]AJJ65711.1 aminomethyltransferase folate-binding domain protein [Yersinia pseudotuberculosis PB1/+]AYX17128.1 tRNA-modifying protein YgfZ [Yersinia pseudotuberculosis]MBO1607329.1 tRNA-modifying prote
MAYHTPFAAQPPVASSGLPLTLISLDDWALVTLTGADRVKYLQGQVTADIDALSADQHVLCAHCDAKGKMWSNLRLFYRGEGLAFIERRSLLDNQLSELKKYAVFSKVVIEPQPDAVLIGVAGSQAKTALAEIFTELPSTEHPVTQMGNSTLLHFSLPAERFLLVTDTEQAQQLVEKLAGRAQFNDSKQWLALDIEAGFPIIDAANSAQFIPQATNIQALNGISFTKGCYTGQEMVARAKYRGANKRALYWLAGNASRVPAAGEDLEWQLGENWRRTGTVLSAIQLNDGTVWVQAVLNNDLAADSVLRVRDDALGTLAIQPLPYSLAEDK